MAKSPLVWWFRDRKGTVRLGKGRPAAGQQVVDWSGLLPKALGGRGEGAQVLLKSRWFWIAGAAVVLAAVVWSHDHPSGGGTGGCQVQVTTNSVNVRAGPAASQPVIDTLRSGQVVAAESVTQNGYRELTAGRWVASVFLRPVAGSSCG